MRPEPERTARATEPPRGGSAAPGAQIRGLGGPKLRPDPNDRLDVFLVEGFYEVPKNGVLEGPRDLRAVAPALAREADQRLAPVALIGAALKMSGIDQLLYEARGAGGTDADE